MFIAEFDTDEVKRECSKILKSFGVKHRLKKFQLKPGDRQEAVGVFKIRLEKLKQKKVKLQQYDQPVSVPAFLVESCSYLRDRIDAEGLFRKPGVALRQKELKQILVSGGRLTADCEHNVTDVADLLKLFFRELPEPCIPYVFHDILQRCLDTKERQKEAVLLAVLLLPNDYLFTLAYLMQFLQDVASHCHSNRMDVSNLTIVWTPNLMPFKTGHVNDKEVLQKRLKIIQLLIENSSYIGMVPQCLYEHLSSWQPSGSISSHDELESSRHREKKKKRRSGSLTRMLSGIKKMVRRSESAERGHVTPENPVNVHHTPRIMSTNKKRKASESTLPGLSKKRRELLELLPHGALLPDVCTTTHLTPRVLIAQPMSFNCPGEDEQPKRRSRFYTNRLPEREEKLKTSRSLSGTRLRLSHFGIGKKHKKKTTVAEESEAESISNQNTLNVSSSSEDYVRIPRSEYEEIKSRVSRIESRISSEFENIVGVSMSDIEMTPDSSARHSIKTVQSAYEKTLESAEKINSPTSDELARKFTRELKIHGSSGKKVIRSPSARKIGSLRRRSKDNVPQIKRNLSLNAPDRFNSLHKFYPVNSVRRVKPNTVCNGLPDPLIFTSDRSEEPVKSFKNQLKPESFECQRESLGTAFESGDFDFTSFGVLTRSQTRSSSFHGCDLSKISTSGLAPFKHVNNSTPVDVIEWKNAEDFLNEEKTEDKSVTGRPSVAKLRTQNAGMVLAKTKLFDTMVDLDSNMPKKAFNTDLPAKSREVKKRNSSKSSKERRLHRKDSKTTRRCKRENSVPKQLVNSSTAKTELRILPRRENLTDTGKENLPKKQHQSLKSSQTDKSGKICLKNNIKGNFLSGKQTSQVHSPLRESNPGSRITRQPLNKCGMLGRSPNVTTRQLPNQDRSTPNKPVSVTPRRSPRQLLLKSRHLSKPLY